MDTVTRVQNLYAAVSVSQRANTLGKGMYPTILPPASADWDF